MTYVESVTICDKFRANSPTILLVINTHPLLELLTFFREKCLSLSSERNYAQAIGRFCEWLSLREADFTEFPIHNELYTAFAHDLRFGLQDETQRNTLKWNLASHLNMKRLMRALIEFSDWTEIKYGKTSINPTVQNANFVQKVIFWRKWNHQKVGSFLAHIKSRHRASISSANNSRQAALPSWHNSHSLETKAFPENKINDLLWKGFINPGHADDHRVWIKYNIRDILISMLCAYGGCRSSEPLHLWVDDVYLDPQSRDGALVFIHHPQDGIAFYIDPVTGSKKKTHRAEFLRSFCKNQKPLTLETGRRHAGWKGCLLTNRERNAFQVIWIDKTAGKIFLYLWNLYLLHVRPVIKNTPWAFLTRDSQPLGVKAYADSFNAAVKRIGMRPTKWKGTSTHGLRHLYGQWLNELEIDDKEGQVAMHHINPQSQYIYRQMPISKVVSAINKFTNIQPPSSFFQHE